MIRYFARKSLHLLVALWVTATVTFVLMKSIPGDPFTQEQALPEEVLSALRRHFRLDQPLYLQYLHHLKALITWDLGPSFTQRARSVNAIISDGFPISALLGLEALIIALPIGLALGTTAALHHNRFLDKAAMLIALLGISVPSFLFAALLQYIFGAKLAWLPVARWGSFWHSILPALSLAAMPMAVVARLMRSSMLEVLRTDYVKTARGKGLSWLTIIYRHGLRNALPPVCTYLGPLLANILVGSFVVERIYGIPGLGQWFISAVTNRDYTVIMGMTVFYAAILLICVFTVDLIYAVLDPRVAIGTRRGTA